MLASTWHIRWQTKLRNTVILRVIFEGCSNEICMWCLLIWITDIRTTVLHWLCHKPREFSWKGPISWCQCPRVPFVMAPIFSFRIVREWDSFGLPLWSSGQSSWLQIQRFWVRFPALPNFLRSSVSGTGSTQPREYNWAPLWSTGYRFRGSGFDSRRCQIFWEVVGRNSSGSGLEIWEYGHGDPLCRPRDTLHPQKLALTSLLRSWPKAMGV
jgi:hypothetical protein